MAAPKKDEVVEEIKDSQPKQEGKGGHPENNDIGPSGDTQAPPPPGNPDSPVAADDDSLTDEEKEAAKEVANHPLAKFGEKVQKASEKEAEDFAKEQEKA